jgi:hypothetical protein
MQMPRCQRAPAFPTLFLLCTMAAPASALDFFRDKQTRAERKEIADIAQPWTIQIEPSAWYVAPGGRLRLPGSPPGAQGPRVEHINLDKPRLSPYGEIHIRSGEWRFSVSSFATWQSDRGVVLDRTTWLGPFHLNPGDHIVSSVDFTSSEIQLGYRLPLTGLVGEGGRDFRGSLEAIGGLRLYALDFEIGTAQGTTSHSDFFPEFLIGVKYTMELWERLNIDVMVSVGGFDDGGHRSSITYDISTGFTYRPVENVGVQVGYRNLAFDLSSGAGADRFNYSGGFAGLFGGVVVRF